MMLRTLLPNKWKGSDLKPLGIVLIHGYSGSTEDISQVSLKLGEVCGNDAVCTVRLPGHEDDDLPVFDANAFGLAIDSAIHRFHKSGRQVVILGHSTGGILAVDHLQRMQTDPALLILAGTPASIQGNDLNRWEQHRSNRRELSLSNVARMVSFVNRVAGLPIAGNFPILILQGGADPLVLSTNVRMWCEGRFNGHVRRVIFPDAGHNLFVGTGSEKVIDCVCRAVADAGSRIGEEEKNALIALQAMDQQVEKFVATRSQCAIHLVSTPAAKRALNKSVCLLQTATTDPIQLNIEITSRCNLSCGYCARSRVPRTGRDMDLDAFCYLLDLMPHTFKVVFVGLGEPTLHPQLTDFVAMAACRGHRVVLVTNAMNLETNLSRRLIDAGISGLTFSLDSVDANLAAEIRQGSDINRIISNIKQFMQLAKGKIPTAIFTAVSLHNVHRLPEIAETAADLGIHAWMLSDLNFQWNQSKSVWQTRTMTHQHAIGKAIQRAFAKSIPVLSVRGVEEMGLQHRFKKFLLTAPSMLGHRSKTHHWCLSPWQTIPVDVDGNATVCDCQPNALLGNLFEHSFSDVWNGAVMQSHRRLMKSETPPTECLSCPRF